MENINELLDKYNISEQDLYTLGIIEARKDSVGFFEKEKLKAKSLGVLKPYNVIFMDLGNLLDAIKTHGYHKDQTLIDKYGHIDLESITSSSGMKYVIPIIVGIVVLFYIFSSSGRTEAEKRLEEVLQITGSTFNGGCRVGNVSGSATIIIDGEKVSVNYSALGYSTTESGVLEDLVLKGGGENNTYRITGFWNNKDAGDGNFLLKVLGAEYPNTIYTSIEGSSWKYYDLKELSDEEFNKVITILGRE